MYVHAVYPPPDERRLQPARRFDKHGRGRGLKGRDRVAKGAPKDELLAVHAEVRDIDMGLANPNGHAWATQLRSELHVRPAAQASRAQERCAFLLPCNVHPWLAQGERSAHEFSQKLSDTRGQTRPCVRHLHTYVNTNGDCLPPNPSLSANVTRTARRRPSTAHVRLIPHVCSHVS